MGQVSIEKESNNFKALKTTLTAIRDLLIHPLPGFLAQIFTGKGRFAFLAHPLDLNDLSRYYPHISKFPKNRLKFISRYHWTVIGSKITGFKDAEDKLCEGWVIYCPLTTRMLVLKRDIAVKKLIRAVKFTEKLGVEILGLGAFVPIVTDDGKLLAEKTHLKIITGASFSAVMGLQNTILALNKLGADIANCQVAIVGAAGSVGTLISQLFAKNFNKLVLIDKNENGLNRIVEKVISMNPKINLIYDTNINAIKSADAIFVATNTPGAIVREDRLKPGSVVIDGAHPRNVSAKVPEQRKDVIVIESGIAEVDNLDTHIDFGLRNSNEVYSCLAEVLILLWKPSVFEYLEQESLPYIETLLKYSSQAGIWPARFQNRLGYISSDDFQRVSKAKRTFRK